MSSRSAAGGSGCGSWIYCTNRTPSREDLNPENLDTDMPVELEIENRLGEVPITLNKDRSMREESFSSRGEILNWNDIVHCWEKYIENKEDTAHILENMDNSDKIYIPSTHRFSEEYQDKQMAKFYSIENKALENYGKEGLTTVMLTLSASPYDNGQILPFTDHLDSIMDPDLGSWQAVKTAISRVLSDYDYNYMRILEPHTPDEGDYATSGYAHQHVALMVNDPENELEDQDFKPVMDAHIRNCKTAGSEAHRHDSKAVSVNPYDEEEGNIGSYLTAYMGEYVQEDPRESERWFKRFLSGLWASNRRRVGFSNEANQWAREDYKEKYKESLREGENQTAEEKQYEYYGIEKTKDNGETEEIEVKNGNSGSYMTSSPYSSNQFVAKISNIWDQPYG